MSNQIPSNPFLSNADRIAASHVALVTGKSLEIKHKKAASPVVKKSSSYLSHISWFVKSVSFIASYRKFLLTGD